MTALTVIKGIFGLAIIGIANLNVPASARNPIIANQGINDPHIHIFGDTAYLYATKDKSKDNKTFVMNEWTVWSSEDLVNWKAENFIDPAETYIGPGFDSAWAIDAAQANGKTYVYFSEAARQTGVVVGDGPAGPWREALGKPLLTADMTPTHEYDPSNRYFRDSFISYIHYRADGTITPIRVNGIGVGEYDASGPIEAEEFFYARGAEKKRLWKSAVTLSY
jgi:hypothetical protein